PAASRWRGFGFGPRPLAVYTVEIALRQLPQLHNGIRNRDQRDCGRCAWPVSSSRKSRPRVSRPKIAIRSSDIVAGAAIAAEAGPKAGTKAKALKPCAINPPSLLQPATQPVVRPRTMMGEISAAYGSRIEMTPLEPIISKDSDSVGNARKSTASSPSVVIPMARRSARLVLQTLQR